MADEKQSTVMKIVSIALVVLVVDVIAGFVVIKFIIPQIYKTETTAAEGEKEKGKDSELPPVQKPLAPINLNPSGSSGEILSTEIVLEGEQTVIDEATIREAQIQDAIITYLSFKTVADLNDIAKREEYKKEMLDKLNSMLTAGKLSGLYTKSWIIQFE